MACHECTHVEQPETESAEPYDGVSSIIDQQEQAAQTKYTFFM